MSMASFKVIEEPAPGMLILERYSWFDGSDRALWSLVKMRKSHKCAATGIDIAVGEEAFRPVGNQSYRYERISKAWLNHAW